MIFIRSMIFFYSIARSMHERSYIRRNCFYALFSLFFFFLLFNSSIFLLLFSLFLNFFRFLSSFLFFYPFTTKKLLFYFLRGNNVETNFYQSLASFTSTKVRSLMSKLFVFLINYRYNPFAATEKRREYNIRILFIFLFVPPFCLCCTDSRHYILPWLSLDDDDDR